MIFRKVVFFFCLVLNKVLSEDNNPTVIEYRNELFPNGGYSFRFVLSDGTKREETGSPQSDGSSSVSGYYSYIDPSGKEQFVSYYADTTGYHPMIGGISAPVTTPPVLLPDEPPPVGAGLPPGLVGSLLGR